MIYGLDVSGYQGAAVPPTTPVDNKPVQFCFVKATQGTSYTNPRMAAQAASARAQGIVVGFYHFLLKGNTAAQVDYFVQQAASVEGDLLAIDWESDPASNSYPPCSEKDAALARLLSVRPTHKALLYCNTSFWKGVDTTEQAGDGLWIATGGYPAGSPPIKDPWVMHQYSTAGGQDHDVAQFSSQDALRAWAQERTDMALSADDIAKVAAATAVAVWTKDGIIPSPSSAPDHATNQFWMASSYLQGIYAQAQVNGGGLTTVVGLLKDAGAKADQALALLQSLDLSQLPADVAAKLADLKFVLEDNGS